MTHSAMRLCGGTSIIQCTPTFLPHNLDTAGKRQCTPSNIQCTTVVSSRKSSRPGRALAPSCPLTWTRQASANAERQHTAQCGYAKQVFASIGQRVPTLLPCDLDMEGKRLCTPSDVPHTAVVSSRELSRSGRALMPSYTLT